jgi:hypothetical protein
MDPPKTSVNRPGLRKREQEARSAFCFVDADHDWEFVLTGPGLSLPTRSSR